MPRVANQTARREEILSAACDLFYRQGFHATTMDDVARMVNLNKGTLYYYYDSKISLLFEIFLNAIDLPLHRLRGYSEDLSPAEFIEKALRDSFRSIGGSWEQTAVYFQEYGFIAQYFSKDQMGLLKQREHEYEKILTDVLAAGMKEGVFVKAEPQVLLRVILSIFSGINRWFRPGNRLSQDAEDSIVEVVLSGLLIR